MSADDLTRLRQMLDAAREAVSFVQCRSRDDLHRDRMLLLSLVKELEIVGDGDLHARSDSGAGESATARELNTRKFVRCSGTHDSLLPGLLFTGLRDQRGIDVFGQSLQARHAVDPRPFTKIAALEPIRAKQHQDSA